MRYVAFFLGLCLLVTLPPRVPAAEEVVLGMSQNRVAITANFDGSEILIFGAIKRDTPVQADQDPIEVVVAIEGPSVPVTVRRKEKKWGIWVNTDSLEIDSAPAFYAVATSGPFNQILSETEDLRYHVSVPKAIRSVGATDHVADPESFTDAVIRIRRKNGLYQFHENAVDVAEQTLFRTSVALPSNLTEGVYKTRVFMLAAASPGALGGVRGLIMLRQVLANGLGALVLPDQMLLPRATEAFGEDGALSNARQREQLVALVLELARAAKILSGKS